MTERIALIGIIVQDTDSATRINDILHEYNEYIVGRMGLPKVEKQTAVISVVLKAPQGIVSAVAGKLGMLEGVQAKAVYAPV